MTSPEYWEVVVQRIREEKEEAQRKQEKLLERAHLLLDAISIMRELRDSQATSPDWFSKTWDSMIAFLAKAKAEGL